MTTEPTLPRDLSRILELLVRRLRAQASGESLTQASASTLGRLDTDGPLGVTQLARLEGVSQPAMTQLVDRMANDGLVKRVTPDHDRRLVRVHVTDAGREALEERRAHRAERLATLLDALSDADRTAIAAAVPPLERLAETVAHVASDTAGRA